MSAIGHNAALVNAPAPAPVFLDVMIDIESSGLNPHDNAMIQLAAVPFDLQSREVDIDNMFCRSLKIPRGRYWDEGTRAWWAKQKPETLAGIYAQMEEPSFVLHDFAQLLRKLGPPRSLRFWAKPTAFDLAFVRSYLEDYGHDVDDLIPHWTGMDLYSWLAGRGIANPRQFVTNHPFDGVRHNALYDCLHQVSAVFAAF